MKNTKIRALADCAIATALCTLLVAISVYVPGLFLVTALFCGLPVMLVLLKHGTYFGIISLLAAFFTVFVFTGSIISAAVLMLMYILPASVFGYAARKKKSFFMGVAVSAVFILVGFVIQLVIFNGGQGRLETEFSAIANQAFEGIKPILALNPEYTEAHINSFISMMTEAAVDTLLLYLPGIAIIFSVILAYIISVMGVFFAKRFKIKEVYAVKFNMIHVTHSTTFVFLLSAAVTFFSDSGGVIVYAFYNLQLISMLAVALSGLAGIDFILERKIKKGFLRAIIYIVILLFVFTLTPFIIDLLILVGLFDINNSLRFPEKDEDDDDEE